MPSLDADRVRAQTDPTADRITSAPGIRIGKTVGFPNRNTAVDARRHSDSPKISKSKGCDAEIWRKCAQLPIHSDKALCKNITNFNVL